MPDESVPSRTRLLSPDERISEILFGLIMVITFTGSLSVAESGRDDVRTMLIGALGCNLAWGIIDAVMYLMACLAQKGQSLQVFLSLKKAADSDSAGRILAGALPPLVAGVMQPAELASIAQRLARVPEPPRHVRLRREDYLGAVGVFLLVFISTLPVTVPFMLMQDTPLAKRISNLIALLMLFGLGFAFGRVVGRNPWLHAISMVLLGMLLVGLTMALGG